MMPIVPVNEETRERIAREFDDRGPQACMDEILGDLRRNNPELLDIAYRCAASLGQAPRVMITFGMFYRLMLAPWKPSTDRRSLSPMPRVTPQTRDRLVAEIDAKGAEDFTLDVVTELAETNPELLQALHALVSTAPDPLGVTQGLTLFYQAVILQAANGRSLPH
jgi:hypothetical protein